MLTCRTRRFYEVHIERVISGEHVRVGWGVQGMACEALDGTGLGDDMSSWALDGCSLRYLGHPLPLPYPAPFKNGTPPSSFLPACAHVLVRRRCDWLLCRSLAGMHALHPQWRPCACLLHQCHSHKYVLYTAHHPACVCMHAFSHSACITDLGFFPCVSISNGVELSFRFGGQYGAYTYPPPSTYACMEKSICA